MVTTDIFPGTQIILTERIPAPHGAEYAAGTAATFLVTTTTPLTGKRLALEVMVGAQRVTVWPHEVELQVR